MVLTEPAPAMSIITEGVGRAKIEVGAEMRNSDQLLAGETTKAEHGRKRQETRMVDIHHPSFDILR